MARSVLLFLLVVATCVLLIQDVEAGKKKGGKMAKKMVKRRIPIIVKDLENNVTALWKEVKQLSQPVHVHLHGDGHVMDPDHPPHHHHHHQEDHEHHSSHDKDLKSSDDDKDDDDNDSKEHHEAPQKDDKHSHAYHKHHHKGHGDEDDDDFKKSGDDDDSAEGDMMGMKKMMRMKKMKHKCHRCRHYHSGEHGEEEEEEEEEEEKWMHGGRKGTHVHIHLHTGKEDEEMGSKHHHHAEPSLPQEYRYARCNVVGNSALPLKARQDIMGTFHIRQMPEQPLEAKATLEGFLVKPVNRDRPGRHLHLRGLHGHEFGDMSNGCNSLGGHLNPFGVAHGGPEVEAEHRHVGDFGNIEVKEDGTAVTSFTDDVASLFGSDSMLGRSLVIHAGSDDLGQGESDSSKASGNAGSRIACCVIVACSQPTGIWSQSSQGN